MGAALVPLLTTVGGLALQQYNTNQTEKRTRNALNLQLKTADQRQREGQALVDATIARTRGSTPETERAASFDSYLDQLRKTQGNAAAGLGQIGAVSDRYTTAANDAAADMMDTGMRRADLIARVDAPVNQRMSEGLDFSRLASDLGRVEARSASDRFLDTLRMQLAQRRNPALDAAGSALIGYGMSGGRFGGGDAAGASAGQSSFGAGSLLGQQASTGQGSIFNFGNNVDAFRRWRA